MFKVVKRLEVPKECVLGCGMDDCDHFDNHDMQGFDMISVDTSKVKMATVF